MKLFIKSYYDRQTAEMNEAMAKVDVWKDNNEMYINKIVAKHFEDQNLIQV